MVIKQFDSGESDFFPQGNPRKDVVEEWVLSIASRINGALAAAGYVLPLEAMTDETWPEYQTEFMSYFNSIGVASLIGDDPQAPTYVNLQSGVRKGRSRYQRDWDVLIEGLEERIAQERKRATSLIRAQTYAGTPAEWLLSQASPPITDGMTGFPHPAGADSLRAWTRRKLIYMREMQRGHEPGRDPFSIDYMRNARSSANILPQRGN